MKAHILGFILMLSFFPVALSQNTKPPKENNRTTNAIKYRYWVDFGIGQFESYDGGGIGLGLSLNLVKGKQLYKIKYNSLKEPTTGMSWPNERLHEIAGLFGRQINYRFFSCQLAVGLGAYEGEKRGEQLPPTNENSASNYYKPIHFKTVGIPIEAGIRISPLKIIGIGLYVEGNLNPQLSTFCYSLKISLGKLR